MDKQDGEGVRRTWRTTESGKTHRYTKNNTKKCQIGKHLAMMECKDSSSRKSPPFMTD